MKKNNKTKNRIYIICVIIMALVMVGGVILFSQDSKETISLGKDEAKMKEVSFNLGDGLCITQIGSYDGKYMEDASDEEVKNVMSIILTNTNENTLQYAEVTLTGNAREAKFSVSTLRPNESVLVLESTRKQYEKSYTDAFAQNVVFFEKELSVYEELLEVQALDGGFNITNISSEDIDGDIIIYFKDCIDGIYYGGITYRGRIEGGLKSGEIRQVMTDNFSESDTEVMFITILEK